MAPHATLTRTDVDTLHLAARELRESLTLGPNLTDATIVAALAAALNRGRPIHDP